MHWIKGHWKGTTIIVLLREAVILSFGLVANPPSWINQIGHATASAAVALIYDNESLESTKDPAIAWLHDFHDQIARALIPGAHLVEFFNWMKHIPARKVIFIIRFKFFLTFRNRFVAWKRMALESYMNDGELLRCLFDGVRQHLGCLR